MPIKDLQKNKPGLSRAGIIRLGYKMRKCLTCKKNVRAADRCPKCGQKNFKTYTKYNERHIVEFPTQADHFVLTDAPGVDIILGESEPKELKIWFPFDDIDQVFPAYHQLWVAGGLVCRGDGEQIQYAINLTSGKPIIRDGRALHDFQTEKDGNFEKNQVMACPGLTHDIYTRCVNCKPNAMLIVLLRDVPRLAYFQIATSSIHNIINLTEQLTYIKDNVGKLQGVPFVLKIGPQEISTPSGDGGKRQRQIKYLLSLEVDPEYYQRIVEMKSQLAAPERRMLDAGPETDGEVVEVKAEIEPTAPAPSVQTIEPPVWMAPNGGDDSELIVNEEPEPKAKAPNSPELLLKLLNTKTDNYFGSSKTGNFHLLNSIKKVAGKDWTWPKSDDIDGWHDAYVKALAYANRPKEESSDLIANDKGAFYVHVMAKIKYYNDPVVIDKAMEELGIIWDVESQEFIFDELAKFAGIAADLRIARQEAETIVGE